jgi:catechol 2,3-dioxygenase-like lactoylglutathione lyase family enzyme
MDPSISVVTLGVDDLETAREFYEDGLGLPRYEWGDDGDVVFFETSGTWLALFPWDELAEDATVPPEGSGFRGFTLAHNVDSTEAVDRVLDEAEAAGATVVKPGQETFWGGYSGYFSDPDGFLWEVAWNPHFDFE